MIDKDIENNEAPLTSALSTVFAPTLKRLNHNCVAAEPHTRPASIHTAAPLEEQIISVAQY